MSNIYQSFIDLFNNGNNSNYKPKKKELIKPSNLVNTQPKKNNIGKQNTNKYGVQLAKLANDISRKTPKETKVLAIIEFLKYNPEKESEIMAKYGKLLKEYKHVYTDKSAYGKSKTKKKTKKSKKSNKKSRVTRKT